MKLLTLLLICLFLNKTVLSKAPVVGSHSYVIIAIGAYITSPLGIPTATKSPFTTTIRLADALPA